MTLTLAPGVAVVIAVHRPVRDLAGTVETFLEVLHDAERPHTVVVVDDTGDAATSAVTAWLAHRHPGLVEVVSPSTRHGHHAATRIGAEAAVARTTHEHVLVTDARGAGAADLAALLADGPPRGLVLGRGPRRTSPDAWAFVDRHVLERLSPNDEDVALAPELVAWTRDLGDTVTERRATRPVGPREPRAVRPGLGARLRAWARRRDPGLAVVTAGSAVGSVLAFLHALAAGTVLAYPDAIAHLLIARRVLDSPTPGITQLGAVWLPLPHLLALPLVGDDALYVSGTAGALVSMAAYVIACRYLYGLVHELTGHRVAAVVAALAFAVCPNVLYLQSTPMTELPFLATVAGAAFHLTRWTRTGRHTQLAAAATLALLATLTRYEAWVFVAAMAGVVAIVSWRGERDQRGAGWRERLRRSQAHVVFFGLVAFAGIVGWFVWNAVIFGDATSFYDGPYAPVALLPQDVADGSWPLTLRTYWDAITDDVGAPTAIAGALGLVAFVVRGRLRPPTLAAATPLVLLPFFVWLLYSGSRPLRVVEVTGMRYNVRFGLIVIIPAAILIGYLVVELARLLRDRRGWATATVAAVLVVLAAVAAGRGGAATLLEAQGFRATAQEQANMRAAVWLRGAYTGGRVLMDTPGNEVTVGDSRLPTDDVVYDGNAAQWSTALASPAAADIDWVYMRGDVGGAGSVGGLGDGPDRVFAALADTPGLAGYRLVYDADDRRIYHRNGSP